MVGMVVVLAGVMAVVSRSDKHPARVAIGPAPSTVPTSSSVPTTDTVPAGFDIGPQLDPEHLRNLSERGVALQFGVSSTVILIALDGRVIGHLDGFDLHPAVISNPLLVGAGPLALGRGDRTLALAGATDDRRLVDTPGRSGTQPLAGGAVLEPALSRTDVARLHLANGTVIDLPFGALNVSADRRWVTSRLPDPAASYSSATAYDASTGKSVHFDRDCFVAHDSSIGRVDVCNDTIRVNQLQIGKPLDGGGHWEGAQVSDDGQMLLAQFSGECEAQSAWFIPLTGTDQTPMPVGPGGTEWDSSGLGWLRDGSAVVSFGPGVCGTALPKGPGVYVVSTTGELQAIYPVRADVIGWEALVWTNAS